MPRGPRAKLPAPVAYTTQGGPLGRDLMLIRVARDCTIGEDRGRTPLSRYWDLEAKRYDAHLHHRSVDGRDVMLSVHRTLVRRGYNVAAIPQGGAVIHHVVESDLPPRLRHELSRWTPLSGWPPSQSDRRSAIPWLLLARCSDDARAYTMSGAADLIPLQRSKQGTSIGPGGSIIGGRRGAAVTTAGQAKAHLRQLGQAPLLRFARHHTADDRDTPAQFGVCAALFGADLNGTQQYLARGNAFAALKWVEGKAWLSLRLVTAKGTTNRYLIHLPLIETHVTANVGRES